MKTLHSQLGIYTSGDPSNPTRLAIVPVEPSEITEELYWTTKMPVKVLCPTDGWISNGWLTSEGYTGEFYENGKLSGLHEMAFSNEGMSGNWKMPTSGTSGDITWSKLSRESLAIPDSFSTCANSHGFSREKVFILPEFVAKTAERDGNLWHDFEISAWLFAKGFPVAEPLCLVPREGEVFYLERRYESSRDRLLRAATDEYEFCKFEKCWFDLLYRLIVAGNVGGDFKLANILFDSSGDRFILTDFMPKVQSDKSISAFPSLVSFQDGMKSDPLFDSPEMLSFRCRLCHLLHYGNNADYSLEEPDKELEEAIRGFLKMMPLGLCTKVCKKPEEFLVIRNRTLSRLNI